VPGTQTLGARFARLLTFNVLANLSVPLAGLIDVAMLGHLAEIRHFAGVALGSVVFDYLYWTAGALRMATTGLTAQAVGRGAPDESARVLLRAVLTGGVCGLLLLALRTPLTAAAFALLEGSPAVEAAGEAYVKARILGAPAVLINLALLGWFLGRAEGRVVLAMTAVANLSNGLLDYVFILRWGLGAQGAGLATMIGQYLSLAVALSFALRRRTPAGGWRRVLDPAPARSMLRLGGNIVVRTVCLTSAFALFTNWSAWLGTTVLAANAILLRVVTTAAYLVDGAAYATESLAGIAFGRRDATALRRLLHMSLITGLGCELLVAAAVIALPSALLGVLTSHGEVLGRATAERWWLLPVMIPGALAYIYDGFFLGLTQGRILRNAMLASLVVFLVPGWWAAHHSSNHGLWAALALFMVARAWLLHRRRAPLLALRPKTLAVAPGRSSSPQQPVRASRQGCELRSPYE